jgi:IS30 family transposase
VSCTRATEMERSRIYVLRQAGKGNNEIVRIIGRDKGAVSREARRNKGRKGYRHQQTQQAQERAAARARRPGPRRFAGETRLDAGIVCGRAQLEGRPHVCRETVCKHVYADAKAGGDL